MPPCGMPSGVGSATSRSSAAPSTETARWCVGCRRAARATASASNIRLGKAGSSWWLYCLLLEDEAKRDDLIWFLGERGIASSPVHARNDKHTGFGGPVANGVLPGVDAFSTREAAIPIGWWLSEEDRWQIVDAVRAWSTTYAITATRKELAHA